MATIYNEADFIGKTFSLSKPAKAYFSYLGNKFYYTANPGRNIGKIRGVVVNKSNGKKYFSVWIDPNRTAVFDYDAANFDELKKQGVRTVQQKFKEDKEAEAEENKTLWDKVKPVLLIAGLGYAGIELGKAYISNGRR